MLKLRFESTNYNSKINGVKKVVFNSDDYFNDDYVLFTNKEDEDFSKINNILTTSSRLFHKYKDAKGIYFLEDIENIEDRAIIRIEYEHLTIMFRPSANHNGIFMTKRCNHYCLMCSEPPVTENDSYLVDDNLKLIELMDNDQPVIGITGGEPTLDRDNFIKIIKHIRIHHPDSIIRLLTNGRSYKNINFVKALSEVASGHLISEIPIYDSDPINHDYIVQSKNAFRETIEGMYNCYQYGLITEVRVVLTKQNYKSLSNLVNYIYKNTPFVSHIAFMGMEYIGFAVNNFDILHIDPNEYRKELYDAISLAETYGIPSSVFNLPLCMIDSELWGHARQSISDWKNEFDVLCEKCDKKNMCAGMFSSTYPHYRRYIKPIEQVHA